MRCPYCKSPLISGPMKEYENLVDHVMHPNAEHSPLRPTRICICSDAALQFWDMEGYVYSFAGMNHKNALDSFAHEWDEKSKAERLARMANGKE